MKKCTEESGVPRTTKEAEEIVERLTTKEGEEAVERLKRTPEKRTAAPTARDGGRPLVN